MHVRAYQDENLYALTRRHDSYAVEMPTGAGKSLEIVALASILVYRDKKKVVIAAPMETIEENFTRRGYNTIARQTGAILAAPPELTWAARDGDEGSIEAIRDYIDAPEPYGHALVCTHSALTFFKPPTAMPKNLSNLVLICDEGHHGAALGLSQVVDVVLERGGRVIIYSATLYRADGAPVVRAGMRVLRRPLALHMEEGFAPSQLVNEIVPIDVGGATEREFHGDEPLPDERNKPVVAALTRRWRADNQPKTLVCIPVMRGGSSLLVKQTILAFEASGARVRDISGDDPAVVAKFGAVLQRERQLERYDESTYDVLVGVQRTREGLDWPLCSTVYCVGLPRHPQTITQAWGRATRLKRHADYPVQHKERAKIVFFVPLATKDSFADARTVHARQTLIVCAFLHNSVCSLDWLLIKHLGKGLAASLGAAASRAVANSYPYIDPELRARAELALIAARDILLQGGSTAPMSQILDLARRRQPDIAPVRLQQVLIEQMAAQTGEAGDTVRYRLTCELNDHFGTSSLNREIEQVFATVLLDFCDAVIVDDAPMRRLKGQIIELTGQSLAHFASQLAQLRPLSPTWLTNVIHEHHTQNGTWPTERSAGPANWPDESWAALDIAIRERQRAWSLLRYGSLREFVNEYARRGTIGQQLQQFAADLSLDAIELVFVECLLNHLVQLRDIVVPLSELPAIDGTADQDYVWALQRWFTEVCHSALHPVGKSYVAALKVNLLTWLRRRSPASNLDSEPGYNDSEIFSAACRGLLVRFCVPTSGTCKLAAHGALPQITLRAGAAGCGRCGGVQPFPVTQEISNTFGQTLLVRPPYVAPTMPLEIFLTAHHNLTTDTAATNRTEWVNVPLSWIDATAQAGGPQVWQRAPRSWRRALARLLLPASVLSVT